MDREREMGCAGAAPRDAARGPGPNADATLDCGATPVDGGGPRAGDDARCALGYLHDRSRDAYGTRLCRIGRSAQAGKA